MIHATAMRPCQVLPPLTNAVIAQNGNTGPVNLADKMEEWRQRQTPQPQFDEFGPVPADTDTGLRLLPDHDEMTAVVLRRVSRPDECFWGFGTDPEPRPKKFSAAMLWQGFRHGWKKLPHRLNRLGSVIRDIIFRPRTGMIVATHASDLRVGAYNDTGLVNTGALAVTGAALRFAYGGVDESLLQVAGKVGERGTVRVRQTVDLKSAGLDNCGQVTVVINGFNLKCESYQKGYNTRGFGVRVIPVKREGDIFEFDVEFSVHPEHAPDRPQPDDLCWRDTHCGEYRYGARINYALIGTLPNRGIITNADNEGTAAYSIAVSGHGDRPARDPRITQARITGHPGLKHAIIGVQGFNWHLEPWQPTRKDGRYIRELEFMVDNVKYDAVSGAANFSATMYFSNDGILPFGYFVLYSMWNALIQTDDDDFVSARINTQGDVKRGESRYESRLRHSFKKTS